MGDERNVGLPWPHARIPNDPLGDVDGSGLNVFMPAIMSVGVLFSVTTLLRDALRWLGRNRAARRVAVRARTTLDQLGGTSSPDAGALNLATRRQVVVTATLASVAATATGAVAGATYWRNAGSLHELAWVLSIGATFTLALTYIAAASWAAVLGWPQPPFWTLGFLGTTRETDESGPGPSWRLNAALMTMGTITALLSVVVVADSDLALDIDMPVASWIVDADFLRHLGAIDMFGSTVISIGLVVLVGLSAFRCRIMALVYPVAFGVVWLTTEVLHELVERSRPTGFGEAESFPSGHMVQAVFIAGMVSAAVGVLLRSPGRVPSVLRVGLGFFVVLTALHRIHVENHWPLDAVAGISLGLTAVIGSHWVLDHRRWHRHCSSCPWSGHPGSTPWKQGLFAIGPATARRLGWSGVGGALIAATTLLISTRIVGLPTSPEGDAIGEAVVNPVQIGLAVAMGLAGLLALRWKAIAAVLMVVCATGIGLLASVQYSPIITFGLASMLLVPAVLTWFAWQPRETIGTIAALAIITVGSLTGTALGSREIYGHYFGPTHPSSAAAPLDSAAEWLWVGGVEAEAATVVAGGLEPNTAAHLSFTSSIRHETVLSTTADEDGIARFDIDGLESATNYDYVITTANDQVNNAAPDGGFRTFPLGAANVKIVVASCARNASNGAVFDQIVSEDPDLYLALGDLHYGDLESTDPGDHVQKYADALSQPGQAALFGGVATAYVWDDHDFGPNDSDSSATSRLAVGAAYRQAVPSYSVDPDIEVPISQAFTIGRVRIVMTDNRSQKSTDSMLGSAQLDWLVNELVDASTSHAVVVWANSTPWISSAGEGSDDWSAYPEERRVIADAIADAGIDNLLMVSGDAHMVAIDDGTNSGYASDGSLGFPVLHAAALDRPGTTKGGPYSHGTFPGSGQYGVLEVIDGGGSEVIVELSGWNWKGDQLVRYRFEIDNDGL